MIQVGDKRRDEFGVVWTVKRVLLRGGEGNMVTLTRDAGDGTIEQMPLPYSLVAFGYEAVDED
jgi:hypothetical protein